MSGAGKGKNMGTVVIVVFSVLASIAGLAIFTGIKDDKRRHCGDGGDGGGGHCGDGGDDGGCH